jgi:hypothetical protein
VSQANRTLLLLAGLTVAAIAIGLYAYYGVQQPDVLEAKVKDRNEKLFDPLKLDERARDGGIPKTEFTQITVTTKDETTTLVREPGKDWRLTSPVQTPADKLAIDQVLSQLQQAKFKQVIEAKPDDAALTRFGLLPPQFVVTAEALVGENGDKRTVRIEGGIENTFDGTVYLRRDGDPQVWSAEGGVRWTLQKSTFDFREKAIFGIEEPKAIKLEVKTKENAYTLERDPLKVWQIVKPIQAPADQATLTGVFGALKGDRALSFPADTAEARKNFEAPMVDATFTLDDGAVIRIRFARVAAQIWMLREEGSQSVLAELPASAAGQLNRNPADLKDRLVLTFKKEQVAKIVFRAADGKELIVDRARGTDGGAGEAWQVAAPRVGPAKTFKIAAVLWTLGAIKAANLGEENPKDWAKYGLDAKARSVTLVGYDGKELARLVVGKDVPGKLGTSFLRGTRNQVIEGDNSRLAELPAVVEDLLDVPGAPAALDAGK